MPGLQIRPFAHYSGTRGPEALASARWRGITSEPGAALSSRLGVVDQQGLAGHFDCCAGAASCAAAIFTAVDPPAHRSVVTGQVD